jgi:hypothetical protein
VAVLVANFFFRRGPYKNPLNVIIRYAALTSLVSVG